MSVAMPNFKQAGKQNLIMFVEGGKSEIFDEQH